MSKTKRGLNYILIITLVYASFYVVLIGIGFFLGSESPLTTVEGTSMLPSFVEGDLVFVKGVGDKRNIKLDEVIVFHEPTNLDRLIIHRVVERIGPDAQIEFVTKGDHNPDTDLVLFGWTVHETHVVGVVVARVPVLGSFIMATQSPTGRVLTAIAAIVVIGVNIFYEDVEESDDLVKNPL